jgi:ATP-dependent DNA helicase RecG
MGYSYIIGNAIIHNDYINGSYPVFEIYDDRIEILSTGGLPVGLTEEEFFKGRSHPRNREPMRIFSDMDLCEQLGSGMKKILRAYSKDIFDISEHFIAVCFPYSKEAVNILNEQSTGGVNGGVIPLSENATVDIVHFHYSVQGGKLTESYPDTFSTQE